MTWAHIKGLTHLEMQRTRKPGISADVCTLKGVDSNQTSRRPFPAQSSQRELSCGGPSQDGPRAKRVAQTELSRGEKLSVVFDSLWEDGSLEGN